MVLNESNLWMHHLKKFLKKDVVVETQQGDVVMGNLRAIGYNHINVIIKTDKERILMKNVASVRYLLDQEEKSGEENA